MHAKSDLLNQKRLFRYLRYLLPILPSGELGRGEAEFLPRILNKAEDLKVFTIILRENLILHTSIWMAWLDDSQFSGGGMRVHGLLRSRRLRVSSQHHSFYFSLFRRPHSDTIMQIASF